MSFNPELAKLAFTVLHQVRDPMDAVQDAIAEDTQEKSAFVAMPGGQREPSPEEQQAQQQQQQQQQAQQQQQQGQAQSSTNMDTMRNLIREELQNVDVKPKKQSPDERMTALEGGFLRLLEHLGLKHREAANPTDTTQQTPTGYMSAGTTGQATGGQPDSTQSPIMGGGQAQAPAQGQDGGGQATAQVGQQLAQQAMGKTASAHGLAGLAARRQGKV